MNFGFLTECYVKEGKSHAQAFADTFEQEDENLTHFLEWENSMEDPVFYHWHHYGKTILRRWSSSTALTWN